MSGTGKIPRIESNYAASSTPGGALPSITLSSSLATILPTEPKNFDYSQNALHISITDVSLASAASPYVKHKQFYNKR